MTPERGVDPNPVQRLAPRVRYRECVRNHAASMGRHVVDGCGEFMPSGSEFPESLKCAACFCHRSFHQKEVDGQTVRHSYDYFQSPNYTHHFHVGQKYPFSGVHDSSGEEHEARVGGSSRRFRTKFSEGQKRKMVEFAEEIDWRVRKEEEERVERFCGEVGVKRKAFKVWMHNRKQAMKKENIKTRM